MLTVGPIGPCARRTCSTPTGSPRSSPRFPPPRRETDAATQLGGPPRASHRCLLSVRSDRAPGGPARRRRARRAHHRASHHPGGKLTPRRNSVAPHARLIDAYCRSDRTVRPADLLDADGLAALITALPTTQAGN